MAFLLDTNIVSYILKAPNGIVAKRFDRIPSTEIFISTVVEAELSFGALGMPPEARVAAKLQEFLSSASVLAWDSACAQRHASLRKQVERNSLSWPDSMIAAHALALDYTLVTHDAAFERVPNLRLQDWTKGPRLL